MFSINESEVRGHLDQLERAVHVPVVFGDLVTWLESVTRAVRRVAASSAEYVRSVHPRLYQQIATDDPELSTCVQQLEEEDDDILRSLYELADYAKTIEAAGERVEPDERVMQEAAKELTERSIVLILRMRKHQTAIATWCTESLLRDRGTVD